MFRQQEIVNLAKTEGRDLTAEEQTEFDNLQRDIETLTAEIEAEEGQKANQNTPPLNSQVGNNASETQRAIEEERERIRSITTVCNEFGMEANRDRKSVV